MRLGVVYGFGSLALVLGVGGAAFLLLQACALSWNLLHRAAACEPPSQSLAVARLARLDADNTEMTRRIFELERELADRTCTVPPLNATLPLSREGWANRDLRMLYGCWDLDSSYRTRDVDTGAIRTYDGWQMCFDGQGQGRQVMRSAGGITCEGPVTAAFTQAGLSVVEGGNLACSDGGYIHERAITCTPAANGRALCATVQAQTGGVGEAGFARP